MSKARTSAGEAKRVVIVTPQLATLQDVAGPWEVFSRAEAKSPGAYQTQVVASGHERTVPTKFGLPIVCALGLPEVKGPVDTLLVAGGTLSPEKASEPDLVAWLRRVAPEVRRVGSICTGAFYLAEAGLLEGRRATTHWRYCAELAARFPGVRVEADPIHVKDGGLYTSAGITAGVDLSLALVEEDLGPAAAHEVARELVVFLRRPADQSQLSAALARQMADRDSIRELQRWLPDHLSADLGVEELAALVNMSPRTFARAFRRETGSTPGDYVDRLRVEAARRRLQEAPASLAAVAAEVGFGSTRSMDRSFSRRLGTTPAQYRAAQAR